MFHVEQSEYSLYHAPFHAATLMPKRAGMSPHGLRHPSNAVIARRSRKIPRKKQSPRQPHLKKRIQSPATTQTNLTQVSEAGWNGRTPTVHGDGKAALVTGAAPIGIAWRVETDDADLPVSGGIDVWDIPLSSRFRLDRLAHRCPRNAQRTHFGNGANGCLNGTRTAAFRMNDFGQGPPLTRRRLWVSQE